MPLAGEGTSGPEHPDTRGQGRRKKNHELGSSSLQGGRDRGEAMRRVKSTSILISTALVLAACNDPGTATETTETSEAIEEPTETSVATDGEVGGEPVTLRMAHTGFVFNQQIPLLRNTVAELSSGELEIVVAPEWDITGTASDVEQQIIQAVADGDVDLGWVGTRAFPPLGVHSFDALTAPFLVDSYPLQRAILDSDIPEMMLTGLDEIGVSGLALMAGGLRKPAAVNAPLMGPDDYAGITFYVFASAIGDQTLTTLGATLAPGTPDDRDVGLVDGTIDGTEQTLVFYENRASVTPYITLNVNLWPGTGVLIANQDMLVDLTDTQEQWLREAATETAARSVELVDVDAEMVTHICDGDGRFSEASEAELSALRDAVEPVYQQVSSDELTRELIGTIEGLKQSVTAQGLAIPDGCSGEAPSRDVTVAEGTDDPSVINGSYRLAWDTDELFDALVSAGVPSEFAEHDARINAGVIVLTFDDGRYDHVYESGVEAGDNCNGTYGISGNRIIMVASYDPTEWDCGLDSMGTVVVDAAWELTDQELVLSDFTLSDEPGITWWNEVFLGSKPLIEMD
jgi:TRAP-type transport system periplasmic protein